MEANRIDTEPVPDLSRLIDLTRMVRYAAATWDWHRLHYDLEYAESLDLPGPMVDGQMFGALMAEQVVDWLGPNTVVLQMSVRFRSPVFSGEVVTIRGAVAVASPSQDPGVRTVDQQVLVDDRVCATGSTTVRLG